MTAEWVAATKIAHMFDTGLPGPEDLATADDSMVIAAITGWASVEAAASARRLAAIAELVRRRADGPTDCAQWSCDNWDSMAAEVAAALHVSHGMASGQVYLGVALRERLPNVAAVFAEGMLSARLVAAIVWRTDLITDEAALALADKTLAAEAIRFGPLSVAKTERAIDAIVDRYDPAALRRTRAAARGRDVVIDSPHGQDGTANLWETLYSTDAAVLDRRLAQMALQPLFFTMPKTMPILCTAGALHRRPDAVVHCRLALCHASNSVFVCSTQLSFKNSSSRGR